MILGCGRDLGNRSIMWIRSQAIPPEGETDAIMASIIYFTAVHADMISLREGITFVLGEILSFQFPICHYN